MNKGVLVAIGLLVGLVAGMGIGFGLATATTPDGPGSPVEAPVSEPQHDSSRRQSDRANSPLPDTTPSRERTLADIIADAEIPAIPSGAARLSGRVLSVDGQPLASVEVAASSSYPEQRHYSGLLPIERVQQEIRVSKWNELSKRLAKTDDNGEYVIDGLAEGSDYTVTATAPGWKIEPDKAGSRWFKPPAEINFVAHAEVEVLVSARMPDGELAERAQIYYGSQTQREQRSDVYSDRTTTLRLTPGQWSIRAVAGDHSAEPLELEVVAGVAIDPIVLQLKKTPGVSGAVILPDGMTFPAIGVYLEWNPDAAPPPKWLERTNDLRRGSLCVEGAGLGYHFGNVADGRYRVIVKWDYRVLAWGDVTVADGNAVLDLAVDAPNSTSCIGLRILRPDGEPLRDVEFGITSNTGGSSYGTNAMATLADDGTYWLARHDRCESQDEVWYSIRIKTTEYGEKSVRYEGSSQEILTVQMQKPAVVELTVSNFNDHPGRTKLFWQLVNVESGSVERSDRLVDRYQEGPAQDPTSPFKFGPMEPGEYNLVLTSSRSFRDSRQLLSRPVTIVSGENSLTELVPPLYSLTVTKGTLEYLPRFTLESLDGSYRADSTSYNTRPQEVVIDLLPPGTYKLRSDQGEMEVAVAEDTSVVYDPRNYDCYVLSIKPAGGRIEALGLLDGDKLIEIDGTSMAEEKLAMLALETSLTKDRTTWTVQRNGAIIPITFSGKDLMTILEDRSKETREKLRPERAFKD